MTLHLRICAAAAGLLIALAAAPAALAQKQGGVLRQYMIDSPASMSIHEEATIVRRAADDGGVQQPRAVRPARKAEQPRLDRARSGDRLVVERGRHRADLPAAPGRQMARRQAVHRRRRQMHLGPAAPARAREKLRVNPRKAWYRNLDEVTTNGDYEVTFRPEAAAAGVSRAARLGLVAGLSLPCTRRARCAVIRSAPARSNSSSSSPTSASRWRGTRITGSRAGPISTASSTRSCKEPVDRDPGLCRRQVRSDLRRHA